MRLLTLLRIGVFGWVERSFTSSLVAVNSLPAALLSFLGAAAGVALAWKASDLLLNRATPGPDPVPLNLAPDFRVLAFTIAVAGQTGSVVQQLAVMTARP